MREEVEESLRVRGVVREKEWGKKEQGGGRDSKRTDDAVTARSHDATVRGERKLWIDSIFRDPNFIFPSFLSNNKVSKHRRA